MPPVKSVSLIAVPLALLAILSHSGRTANDMHPIIDARSGFLLGGSAGGKWLPPEKMHASLSGKKRYRTYSATRYLGEITGGKPESVGAPCEETLQIALTPKIKGRTFAIGGTWNALPRPPRITSTNQATYRTAITEILQKNGITKPQVTLSQVWRIDLEGDGVEEVLISANRFAGLPESISPNTRAGDYSLVVLRKVIKGKVRTILLTGEFYPKAREFNAPTENRIAAVLDVNGDGRMEILLDYRYYEGEGTVLFQITGDKVKDVLSAGCGA